MALADEQIARARKDKLDSMKTGIGQSFGLPNQNAIPVGQDVCDQQATTAYRPPTMAEQAEKNAAYHFEEYNKAHNVSYFFQRHPEFDEFIRLVRSGAIQFVVLGLCAAAALAQTTQTSHGAHSPNIANVKGNVSADPPPPGSTPSTPSPVPALSTAERTALASLEKQKQDAQSSFSQAEQSEAVIEREFAVAHSGWHVNSRTFTIEADISPEKPKPGLPGPPPPATPKK